MYLYSNIINLFILRMSSKSLSSVNQFNNSNTNLPSYNGSKSPIHWSKQHFLFESTSKAAIPMKNSKKEEDLELLSDATSRSPYIIIISSDSETSDKENKVQPTKKKKRTRSNTRSNSRASKPNP